MLWRVLQSNSGLPAECVVCFANTGKEDEATLRFVRDCGKQWSVPVVWVEYLPDAPGYRIVDFETALRDGEPFEALIRHKNYLPNPVARFCTSELKIRPMYRWLRDSGQVTGGIDMMIGIRADEQRRVAKIRAGRNSESVKVENVMPLADAGVTAQDVAAFWREQPFNLYLDTNAAGRTTAGNCDLCFLKPPAQRLSLIAERPGRAVWWVRMEALALALASRPSGARFTKDGPSYAQLAQFAADQPDMFDDEQEAIACFCGD